MACGCQGSCSLGPAERLARLDAEFVAAAAICDSCFDCPRSATRRRRPSANRSPTRAAARPGAPAAKLRPGFPAGRAGQSPRTWRAACTDQPAGRSPPSARDFRSCSRSRRTTGRRRVPAPGSIGSLRDAAIARRRPPPRCLRRRVTPGARNLFVVRRGHDRNSPQVN